MPDFRDVTDLSGLGADEVMIAARCAVSALRQAPFVWHDFPRGNISSLLFFPVSVMGGYYIWARAQ